MLQAKFDVQCTLRTLGDYNTTQLGILDEVY